MKSDIFKYAISNRLKIRFYYNFKHTTIEPYMFFSNKSGSKVLYGKSDNSNEISKFEFKRIFNIQVLNNRKFSPVVSVAPVLN